ncbi:MAG: DUF2516 family protein [Angustibacter sp.]
MVFNGLASAQSIVLLVLGVAAFIVQVFAVVDGARRPAAAYLAAGKLTKQRWMIILGVAVAIGFVFFLANPLSFLNIIAFVAAAVYLADVRPALQRMSGGSSGSYGPW